MGFISRLNQAITEIDTRIDRAIDATEAHLPTTVQVALNSLRELATTLRNEASRMTQFTREARNLESHDSSTGIELPELGHPTPHDTNPILQAAVDRTNAGLPGLLKEFQRARDNFRQDPQALYDLMNQANGQSVTVEELE